MHFHHFFFFFWKDESTSVVFQQFTIQSLVMKVDGLTGEESPNLKYLPSSVLTKEQQVSVDNFFWVNFAAAPESGAESVLCFSSGRAHGAPPSPGTEECLCQNAHFGAALMNEAVTATTLPRWGFLSEVAAWLRPSGVTETLCANDGLREFERRCFSHSLGGWGVEGEHSDWLARVCVDPLMLPEAGGGQGRDGGKGDRKWASTWKEFFHN